MKTFDLVIQTIDFCDQTHASIMQSSWYEEPAIMINIEYMWCNVDIWSWSQLISNFKIHQSIKQFDKQSANKIVGIQFCGDSV